MVLRITNDIVTLSNAAGSFKPFDMSEALGDTTQTQLIPPPKRKGCGVLGQILLVVVAVIVTIYTAGAAAPPSPRPRMKLAINGVAPAILGTI